MENYTDTTRNCQNSAPVALITGAARRVGAVIAKRLHQAGYSVVIHFRHAAKEANELAQQLNQIRKQSAACLQADLDNPATYEKLIMDTAAIWQRLDLLVNNASTFFPTTMGEATLSDWDLLFNSNLKAPFYLSQAAFPFLQKHQGAIVNITDIHAQTPMKNYPIYSCAKAGLKMLTASLALEYAPDVRVNAVAPGSVIWPENENTLSEQDKQKIIENTLLQKQVSPNDIAETVLFLAKNTALTGQMICVDGGRFIN